MDRDLAEGSTQSGQVLFDVRPFDMLPDESGSGDRVTLRLAQDERTLGLPFVATVSTVRGSTGSP